MDNKLPNEACAYEEYDPDTLLPLNNATSIRLLELGWTSELFQNRSVLDIGCNTGALSVYALKLGAQKITAIDVQEPLVRFFMTVASQHQLNINVEQRGFDSLKWPEDCADVVLMMEVLHWLVDQGEKLPPVIEKLASLTNETLFIETPWDVNEPSIAKKNILKSDDYSCDLIFLELSKYFEKIEFIRFMTYFGQMKDSKRILIKASNPRSKFSMLKLLNNAFPVSADLGRGKDNVGLLTSPTGPVVVKKLPTISALVDLTKCQQHELVRLFKTGGLIPPPLLIEDSFIYQSKKGESYMAFPFCGVLSDHLPQYNSSMKELTVQSILKVALDCRKILREASQELVDAFTPFFCIDKSKNVREIVLKLSKVHKYEWLDIIEFLDQTYSEISTSDINFHETLIHGDIQSGNIVEDSLGNYSLIDIDSLRTGTIYTDLLIAGIFSGASEVQFTEYLEQQGKDEVRLVLRRDLMLSVYFILGWLELIVSSCPNAIEPELSRVLRGLQSIQCLYNLSYFNIPGDL